MRGEALMTGVDTGQEVFVDAECFQAYVSAEIKLPNTLIAVGPYVGRAVLASLQTGTELKPALTRFATTYTFSRSQLTSASRAASVFHRRFGIPVLPEGVDLRGEAGIRVFPRQRFEVVYMEGVLNILEAILRLHGRRGDHGVPRAAAVAEVLQDPVKLAATLAIFVAAEDAVNSAAATELGELFKAKFNFAQSGERPRAMAPEEKDAIQADIIPIMLEAIKSDVAQSDWQITEGQAMDFVQVLTSLELHAEAA
jgi:hypothetical protein